MQKPDEFATETKRTVSLPITGELNVQTGVFPKTELELAHTEDGHKLAKYEHRNNDFSEPSSNFYQDWDATVLESNEKTAAALHIILVISNFACFRTRYRLYKEFVKRMKHYPN